MVIVVLMIVLISVVCDEHNGVEPDDPSHLLIQAASVGEWHIHKEGNVWLEDDNFKVQCVSE